MGNVVRFPKSEEFSWKEFWKLHFELIWLVAGKATLAKIAIGCIVFGVVLLASGCTVVVSVPPAGYCVENPQACGVYPAVAPVYDYYGGYYVGGYYSPYANYPTYRPYYGGYGYNYPYGYVYRHYRPRPQRPCNNCTNQPPQRPPTLPNQPHH